MQLLRIRAEHFRCVHQAELALAAQGNCIVGENGAGKTSLLEAMYLLATGRTQRGDGLQIVTDGETACTVFGELKLSDGTQRRAGVERGRDGSRMRLDGTDCTRTDLVSTLPLLLLNPALHALVEEGPEERRRFLDWGVFHVEHGFHDSWRRYRRLLKQRNADLQGGSGEVQHWDVALQKEAEVLDAQRRHYLESLAPHLQTLAARLFRDEDVGVEYQRGWPQEEQLGETLQRNLGSDRERGYTRAGPHRADLRLKLGGAAARKRLSRGEQKLLSLLLTLAQIRLHLHSDREPPVLLLDDLAAELSTARREQVMALLEESGIQYVMTAIETPPDPGGNLRMFHVEHGVVTAPE